MAISNRICSNHTASLLGAAFAGLVIAGGGNTRADDFHCELANNGAYNGTAFSNISVGQKVRYNRYSIFSEGDGITITLAPNNDNPLAFSYYSFYALGKSDIFLSGVNFGNQQQLKLFPTGNGPTGGTVDITDNVLDQVVEVLWSCVSSGPARPVVSSITPNTGPQEGGTTVNITGKGFTGATAVHFYGHDATAFTVNSDTSITAVSPAGFGKGDVSVVGAPPRGESNATPADIFSYNDSLTLAPTVTSMTSNVGYAGTEITITGTNFLTGVTNVQFGSISIPKGFLVISATSIIAISPAGQGTVDVTVTNSGGTSASNTADEFTYGIADTHDFNGDTNSDILWRNASGDLAMWLMSGSTFIQGIDLGPVDASWSIVAQRDFDGDGNPDLLWRDTSGNTSIWFLAGGQVASATGVGNIPINWSVAGAGDFDGDGKSDILWQDSSGNLAVWLMNGATVVSSSGVGNVPGVWTIVGIGDYNGDGKSDLLWRDSSGNTAIWFMNGVTVSSIAGFGNIPTSWSVVGTGDFNGDRMDDIVWRDTSGDLAVWLMKGATVLSSAGLGNIATVWSVALTGDYNGDGKSDLLWRDSSGNTAIWFMNGVTVSSTAGFGNIPTNWTVQSVNAE